MPDNREPLEKEMDAQDILTEMDRSRRGLDQGEMSGDWHMGYYQRAGCINCGSPEALAGGFCGSKCKAEYVGEA